MMEFTDNKENQLKNVCCSSSRSPKVTENVLELSSDTSINSGEEKCDIGPENSKKSCDTSPEDESIGDSLDEASKHDSKTAGVNGPESCKYFVNNSKSCDINLSSSSNTLTLKDDDKSPESADISSRSLAFTIDFGDDKVINSKKYNDIVQRFQKRHRRGVSLSKLDDKNSSTMLQQQQQQLSAITKFSKPPLKKSVQKLNDSDNNNCSNSCVNSPQVKLRDKSLLHSTKESTSQRHSWSPRTSLNITKSTDEHQSIISTTTFKPKSATLQKAQQQQQIKRQTEQEIICQKAPLEYAKNSDDDSVSDAGTYTIYGDNYTEEQKAQMCIDKFPKLIDNDDNEFIESNDDAAATAISNAKTTLKQSKNLNYCDTRQSNIEPTLNQHLELFVDNNNDRRRKTNLEFRTSSDVKPTKTSYLEKIKSKVKNIGDRAFHKNRLSSPDKQLTTAATNHYHHPNVDVGNFTSITASGVFSKKPQTPQLSTHFRRNSLTKLQIDNSEYIQNSNNQSSPINDKLFNSYTDYEKARHHEYKLNIFTTPTPRPSTATPTSNHRTDSEKYQKNISERLALETAETKNDWIQEWAKNARKNTNISIDDDLLSSSTSSSQQQQQQRKLKYIEQELGHNLAATKNHYDQFGDNLDRNYSSAKNNDRLKRNDFGSDSLKSNQLRTPYVQNYYQTQYNQNSEFESDELSSVPSSDQHNVESDKNYDENVYRFRGQSRPPISPSKIPSPMHTLRRGRSCSANRDMHGGSNTDLDDTEMYLQKTAAAISTLQYIHNNSPKTPSSPVKKEFNTNFLSSPSIRRLHKPNNYNIDQTNSSASAATGGGGGGVTTNPYTTARLEQLHKRNLSLDGIEFQSSNRFYNNRINNMMSHSYDSDEINNLLKSTVNRPHSRHNSYEDKTNTIINNYNKQYRRGSGSIEQTFSPQILLRNHISTKYQQPSNNNNNNVVSPSQLPNSGAATNAAHNTNSSNNNSNSKLKKSVITATHPITNVIQQNQSIKRSSSFTTKKLAWPPPPGKTLTPKLAPKNQQQQKIIGGLQKSASSNSFKNMTTRCYDNNMTVSGGGGEEFYLNDEDDLNPTNLYSSESEFSEPDNEKEPISNTRYNKAFLIRMEQNKSKAAGLQQQHQQKQHGVIACPNTPEMPRRDIRLRSSLRDRASMPRDSSLNRMKQDIPSLNISKKVLTTKEPSTTNATVTTTSSGKKVLPKYMDISKYKPTAGQGNTFLKRDESKSTLVNKEIKRSNSAFVGLNKADAGRSSMRSVKSASSGTSRGSHTIGSSSSREAELAMWKRRASYDPMKAAAEGKKKQEEARKALQSSKFNDSSVVLRSQSFHSGVGQSQLHRDELLSTDDIKNRWTLISTESSDDEFIENY